MLTMRYRILDMPANYQEARKDIDLAVRLMNERFTWPYGKLSLTPSAAPQRDRATGLHVVARDSVLVADDRWSAILVIRFLRWVSERLPRAFVELDDESGLCPLGRVTLVAGRFGVPVPRDARKRRRLEDRAGGPDALKRALAASDGDFLLDVPAWPYAVRPEVQRLGLREDDFQRMSLQELADRMPLPWKTERLGAA
jgi:hypothetical protein